MKRLASINAQRVSILAALAAAPVLAGCMNSPRNGQEISSYRVNLEGYTVYSNELIEFHQWDAVAGRWVPLSQGVQPSTSGVSDGSMTWYPFSGQVAMANGAAYWRTATAVGSQRRIRTKVASHQRSAGYLASFDLDADACMEQQPNGVAIGSNCASDATPAAELFLPCGRPDQYCCVAQGISSAQRCDRGRLCSSSRCSIAAGGKNQPCNVNGTACNSGLACISGTCRDTKIENLPLLTLELRVKTCSDTSWVDYQSGSNFYLTLGGGTHFVEVPGTELQAGSTDTFGMRIPGINRLADITELRVTVNNAQWCTDRVELLANSQVVFSKSYSPSLKVLARYPQATRTAFAISRDELRTFWTQLNSDTHCTPPASVSGATIERTVAGLLGDALSTTDEIRNGHFDGNDFVRLVRDSASTFRAQARYSATTQGLELDIEQQIDFTLQPTCQNGSLGLNMSPVRVLDIDGDASYDILNGLTAGWLEFAAVKLSQNGLNDVLGGLRGGLQTLVNNLPGCPTFSLDTSSPPNVIIGYPVPRTEINLCD